MNGEVKYTTVSATDGEYLIYDIDPGKYTVDAYSEMYKTSTTTEVDLLPYITIKLDLVAKKKFTSAMLGTINGIITDKVTKEPIGGAYVALYRINDGEELFV